ncbi:MAG: hypothetical protein Q7U04_06470 [Bacteriovorax sp.]|nr:hypothetical protein [Bacteriovorax sp.]
MEDKAEAELTKLLKDKIITLADIKVLLRWVSEMEGLSIIKSLFRSRE